VSRRASPPGEGPKKRRPRKSQYLLHLRAKQKARRIYGIRESQFRVYVARAKSVKGATGQALLAMLEQRLDNMVYRAGFASSRQQARQLVVHGHFALNGRASNVPSILLRGGDVVSVKAERREKLKSIVGANQDREIPAWVERNGDAMRFQMLGLPNVAQMGLDISANLIVEFYSR
jgi:small subunit ribosomal protein S4